MEKGGFSVLSGDFKKGAGHSFAAGKLILVKAGDDDLKEEISAKAITGIAVKKVEGATRGFVPFECSLKDGRSFIAETDIETYKSLTKQAQENNKTRTADAPMSAEKTAPSASSETQKSEKKQDKKLTPARAFWAWMIGGSILLYALHTCTTDEKLGNAYKVCKDAIKEVVLYPDSVSIPLAHEVKLEHGYRLAWLRGTNMVRPKNSFGMEMPVEASCETDKQGTRILYFEFDGKIIIDRR